MEINISHFMKDFDNKIFTELLLCMISRELVVNLEKIGDKEAALRKALLYLIYLTQDNCSPAGQDFIQYLLNEFSAIREYDEQFLHPFIFNQHIKVASLDNDDKQVVLNTKFFEDFSQALDENKLLGEKLPHSLYEKIDEFFNKWKN